jgi:hypothetical protein
VQGVADVAEAGGASSSCRRGEQPVTLALLLLDEQSVPRGGTATVTSSAFAPAVHKKVGVRQPDVPSHGGGIGLAMRAWLGGLRWRTILS